MWSCNYIPGALLYSWPQNQLESVLFSSVSETWVQVVSCTSFKKTENVSRVERYRRRRSKNRVVHCFTLVHCYIWYLVYNTASKVQLVFLVATTRTNTVLDVCCRVSAGNLYLVYSIPIVYSNTIEYCCTNKGYFLGTPTHCCTVVPVSSWFRN